MVKIVPLILTMLKAGGAGRKNMNFLKKNRHDIAEMIIRE